MSFLLYVPRRDAPTTTRRLAAPPATQQVEPAAVPPADQDGADEVPAPAAADEAVRDACATRAAVLVIPGEADHSLLRSLATTGASRPPWCLWPDGAGGVGERVLERVERVLPIDLERDGLAAEDDRDVRLAVGVDQALDVDPVRAPPGPGPQARGDEVVVVQVDGRRRRRRRREGAIPDDGAAGARERFAAVYTVHGSSLGGLRRPPRVCGPGPVP